MLKNSSHSMLNFTPAGSGYYVQVAHNRKADQWLRAPGATGGFGMPISQPQLIQELLDILDETFENHHGIYLDKGTSLFQTLETIDARQASQPVGDTCASIAAQVAHVTFYLEVLERYIVANDTSKADWDYIWRTVRQVTPAEWEQLKANLQQTYRRLVTTFQNTSTWESDPHLSGALAITVHTAYHLGEIRQALCTIR
jgi:hypothetical protein